MINGMIIYVYLYQKQQKNVVGLVRSSNMVSMS